MAFEVDRLHRLISLRAEDEGVFNALNKTARSSSNSVEPDQSFSWSCSPQGAHAQYPASFLYDTRGFDQGCDTSRLPLESSSSSTETESDEDDNLLENLAQQIAQSMLDDEETTFDMCAPDVLKGNTHSAAQDLPNADLNEGRVSPVSWSSGSWSSGPLQSGSQSSSSKGSSRVSSQVSSPSSALSSGYQDAWETLYAAAGEVARLKMNGEKKVPVFSGERPSPKKVLNQAVRAHVPQQTRSLAQVPGISPSRSSRRKEETVVVNNQAQQNWSMHVMGGQGRSQYPQYQQQQHQQAYNVDGYQGVINYRHSCKSVDNKTSQRNRQEVLNGCSGVRVVFLGAPYGRESAGTGVFLPRTFASTADHKKKNENTPLSTRNHGGLPIHAKGPRESAWPTLQQSMNRSSLRQPVAHEPCLPTEWTY